MLTPMKTEFLTKCHSGQSSLLTLEDAGEAAGEVLSQ